MNYMFKDCKSLKSLEISNFDVSNIKNFDGMFSGCSMLTSLNISNFDTINAITMDDMFNGCSSLRKLDISNFDTSQTTSIKKMFYECKSLTTLNISHFNTSLISSLEYLFYDCSELNEISLSNFDTSLVTNFAHMFDGCSNLKSIYLENFNTSKVNTMEYMFYRCSSLVDINVKNFDTSSVTNMAHMFEECISLTSIDLSGFNTSSVQKIEYMFSMDINLAYINFQNYEEIYIENIFNIFQGSLENMVLCFDDSKPSLLRTLVENKGCSIIDCSHDAISNRKRIIATTNQCVDNCPDGFLFLFDYKCYFRCPDGSYPDNYVCKKSFNITNSTEECTIKNYFLGNCKFHLDNSTQKRKFIESTVTQILRSDLYDLVLRVVENQERFIIREDNEVYEIYSLKDKRRENNITYIDFGECGIRLKENNRLIGEEDIIVFKIEYTSPDFKIPIIEYALFGIYGTKRLNLYTCNDIKFNYYIPKIFNNFDEYKYNPENDYYNDECHPAVSDNLTDLTLKERMNLFNDNNMSLCESMCTFKGYEYNNIICECKIKVKFNSFLNFIGRYNLIYRFEETQINKFNFWVIKCFYNLLTKEIIMKNLCSIIILGILFFTFIGAISFCIKEKDILNFKIQMLIESTLKNEERNSSNKKVNYNIKESEINIIKFEKTESRKSISRLINKTNNKLGNSNNIYKKIYNKKKLMQNTIKEFDKYTDNELNNLSYFDAILQDKRTFFQIYISLINTKQVLLFALGCKNDFNPRFMKISFMFSIFVIFLTINTIFVNESTLHNLFISNGNISILSDLSKIGYSILISEIIKNILLMVSFPENDIVKIRKSGIQRKDIRNPVVHKSLSIAIIRCYVFYLVSFIFLSFIWIYITSFFIIFQNTQMYVIRNTIISFGASLVAPFILSIIPSFFRTYAVKGDGAHGNYCLYIITKIFQNIV